MNSGPKCIQSDIFANAHQVVPITRIGTSYMKVTYLLHHTNSFSYYAVMGLQNTQDTGSHKGNGLLRIYFNWTEKFGNSQESLAQY